ncbi:hypothetical protein BDZ97DRAFT_591670 [Flammula alnicola]|nr:hypothetical protein BDZ97DRAFT_591670 [Flammula alnicola]
MCAKTIPCTELTFLSLLIWSLIAFKLTITLFLERPPLWRPPHDERRVLHTLVRSGHRINPSIERRGGCRPRSGSWRALKPDTLWQLQRSQSPERLVKI